MNSIVMGAPETTSPVVQPVFTSDAGTMQVGALFAGAAAGVAALFTL
jgi:hypothetical protein